MGIPYYFYNIYQKYNTENDLTIKENDISKFDIEYLFLDYNSMIHPCAQQTIELLKLEKKYDLHNSQIEEFIINDCIKYTRYIINIIKPKYLYIMIDGVAPRAKINQQRERRYKSHFFKQLQISKYTNEKNSTNDTIDDDGDKEINWNSNKITPGTSFMDKLIKSLNDFKINIMNSNLGYSIEISDSNSPGEGEHKMMNIISNMISCPKKICIYGLDADLIMLSLINKYSNNIILIRDNTFNTKLTESQRVYTYVNIGKLKTYVCKDVRSENVNLTISRISDMNLVHDYIFLCFLLGNDFLEHVPSLIIKEGGINVIIKYYHLVMNNKGYSSLVNVNALKYKKWNECINLDMLKDLFYHLSKSEEYFYKNVYSVYKNNSNKKIYKDKFDLDKINESTLDNNVYFYKDDIIKYNETGYKNRYYKFYNMENKNDAIKDYLLGLIWIFGYYNGHVHENWQWFYAHECVPFASDIYDYLSNNKNNCKFNLQPSLSNTTLQQLFMVLSRDSLLEIIKEQDIKMYDKVNRIFNTQSLELDKYYPKQIFLEMINKEYLWQSKIFLKTFNSKIINIFI